MKKKKKVNSKNISLLISIPLIIAGIAVGYSTVSCLIKWRAMKSWEKVPATIQKADLLVKHNTTKNGSSTSYKVTASYSYTYDGQPYTGSRVTMHSGYDSFSYHKKIHEELLQYQKSGQAFQCYVNPDNPSESILYRKPRWEKIYAYFVIVILFGGTGLVLLFLNLKNRRIEKQNHNFILQYPLKPWLWQKEWREGRILSHSKMKAAQITAVAIIWNLISSLFIYFLYGEFKKGDYIVLLFSIFPIVGIGLAIHAVRLILRWLKFGQSTFELHTIPGVIGGPLKGKIHTRVNIKPEDGFHLKLTCINRVVTKSGNKTHTREHVRWQDECTIERELYEYDPSRSVIPVLFHIPNGKEQTSDEDPKNQIFWRLEINARVPGVDYSATFDVPVFRTPESSEDFVPDKSSIASYEKEYDLTSAIAAEGIKTEPLPSGGQRYIFPAARHKAAALIWTLISLFFIGIGVVLFKLEGISILTISIAFVNIIFLFVILDSWFFNTRIDIYPQMFFYTQRLLFLKKTKQIEFADIEGFRLKKSMSSGHDVYYSINAIIKNTKKNIMVAKDIHSRRLAENIIKKIETILVS